jgi:hypothetical protein
MAPFKLLFTKKKALFRLQFFCFIFGLVALASSIIRSAAGLVRCGAG